MLTRQRPAAMLDVNRVSETRKRHMEERLPTSLQEALAASDIVSERIAAFIRVVILAVLAAAVFAARAQDADHKPLEFAVVVYGIGTAGGLLAVWRRYYHPLLPYLLVGFDVLTLTAAIVLIGTELGVGPLDAFTLPISGLLVVIFLHASLRYSPKLILFGAVLLALAVLVSSFIMELQPRTVHAGADEHLLHFRLFPVAIFVLTAGILVMTTQRTRRLIAEVFKTSSQAATFSRYFSPQVARELTDRSGAAEFGNRIRAAILFADLQGFTAMAEAMDPRELAQFVSEFRRRISRPVLANQGIIDKYIGDAVMAIFGAPRPGPDDARRALLCAIAMVEEIEAWSTERQQAGKSAVRIAIGGHYGDVFAGVLSDGSYLEYTAIGDTVNIASRLARLPRALSTPLVLSTDLVAASGLRDDRLAALPPQSLPGHPRPIGVHKLVRKESP